MTSWTAPTRRPLRGKRTGARVLARLEVLAVVALALLLAVYGERWMLRASPRAFDELTVATCLLDSVDGAAAGTSVCANPTLEESREHDE